MFSNIGTIGNEYPANLNNIGGEEVKSQRRAWGYDK
jgi:hypothetical protein